MCKGRAPTPLELYRIKDNYKDPQQALFVSMGDTHEERVKNFVSYLDNLKDKALSSNND